MDFHGSLQIPLSPFRLPSGEIAHAGKKKVLRTFLFHHLELTREKLSIKCGLAITSLTTMLERMENQGLISRVQSETDKRKTLLFLTEKAHALKGEYDSVSDEMGSIYYKGF